MKDRLVEFDEEQSSDNPLGDNHLERLSNDEQDLSQNKIRGKGQKRFKKETKNVSENYDNDKDDLCQDNVLDDFEDMMEVEPKVTLGERNGVKEVKQTNQN
jgi:hypothetical protein